VFGLYVDYADANEPLPPHSVVFNAIGDADLCAATLLRAEEVLARTAAPVVNAPAHVRATGRVEIARRFASLPDLIVPSIQLIPRDALRDAGAWSYPLLLRAPGYHMGRHFVRVERREDLSAALESLPGADVLAIDHLDARGPDGLARKYRVMMIDGSLYPLHLAISNHWKVHYFSSGMASDARHREEERRFLDDMPGVLGARAVAALKRVSDGLGLDYAGIDFGLAADGSVLLFEANATMIVAPPPPDSMWDYRRAAYVLALEAGRRLVRARAGMFLDPREAKPDHGAERGGRAD
jgi:glutathione synthase/RimK-type ligase-like ATP-grasp enzyme